MNGTNKISNLQRVEFLTVFDEVVTIIGVSYDIAEVIKNIKNDIKQTLNLQPV